MHFKCCFQEKNFFSKKFLVNAGTVLQYVSGVRKVYALMLSLVLLELRVFSGFKLISGMWIMGEATCNFNLLSNVLDVIVGA